jgi:multiple sugar transport system substrate-binding protein
LFKEPLPRREFIRNAGISTAALLLGACAPRLSKTGPFGSGEIQLVYQDWRTDWFPGLASQMLARFSDLFPSIHVFFTSTPENLTEQMLEDFEAGTAPDVLAGCCEFLPEWAQKGYLMDLKPFIEADLNRSVLDDWSAAQFNALSLPGGQQFAVPKYHGALALFFNKDIFDKYNVPYPDDSWTHDDYQNAMSRIRRINNVSDDAKIWPSMIEIAWERLQVHVNGWGGHFVDPQDNHLSLMGEERSIEAFRWIKDQMWSRGHYATIADVNNLQTRHAFSRGLTAMVEDGSWALKDILENANFRVGVATFPAGPAKKVTLATTDGFAIYKDTRYPEAAWELVKFLTSEEYGRALIETHLLQPARASLIPTWIDVIHAQYPEKARELDLEAFTRGHTQGYSVTAEIFAYMGEARTLARSAWNKIFHMNSADVEILREVSLQIQETQQARGDDA